MSRRGEEGAACRTGRGRIFAAVAVPVFLAAVDQTTIAMAQPAIASNLGGGEFVSWIMVAYLFAITIAVPILGSAGDVFGRRRLLSLSLLVAVAGAGLCAAAPTIETLIAARMVQGVGGGGCIALALAMIGELVPARERGRFHGYVTTVMVTASAAGPLIGGVITEAFGWRALFLAEVPVGLAGWLLLRRVEGRPGAGHSGPFDVAGLLLLSLTVTLAFALMRYVQSREAEAALLAGGGAAVALLLALFVRVGR